MAYARSQLPALVHSAEAGTPISLTRRGKPVAMLLSIVEYQRLSQAGRGDFLHRIESFRAVFDRETLDLAGALGGLRDPSSRLDGVAVENWLE